MPPSPDPHDSVPITTRLSSLWPDTLADDRGSAAAPHDAQAAAEGERLRKQAAAAFDVCHPGVALRALLLVQLALLAVALAAATAWRAWLLQHTALAFGGLVGTLLWLAAVCALRRPLQRLASGARAAVVLGIGALAALAAAWPLAWAGFVSALGAPRLAGVALGGTLLAGLLWAWLDLRSRIWHPGHASARLAELQSRIRPHFLFNALNTAIALVRTDPLRAESVLEDLAQLFRVALADAGASIALADEIELARRYLAIEQLRFGPRLEVQWQVDARVGAARVPPLVLQPLVENAVRHGIEPSPQPGWVRVQAQRRHGQVEVTVANTVGDGTGTPGHGIALANLHERLRLLHDVAARLETWREMRTGAEVFCARIILPAP